MTDSRPSFVTPTSPPAGSSAVGVVEVLRGPAIAEFAARRGASESPSGSRLGRDVQWLLALSHGLRHEPFLVVARVGDSVVGHLPLIHVRTVLFGRYLVSLPYVNSSGVVAADPLVRGALIDRAAELADRLGVKHMELRHETRIEHPRLAREMTGKVHMRLPLPPTVEALWAAFDPKVRNQIRKAEKHNFHVAWGRDELLADFHGVFSRNMRDLGTPVYGRRLFRSLLARLDSDAELCLVRDGARPLAAALLVHSGPATEVPSASSLREFNHTNANMLLYWALLQRAIARRQPVFDFGRSTQDAGTYRFKKQWGAEPQPAVWQYYVRRGDPTDMRPESRRYRAMIGTWKRLPVWLTRLIGPPIVRGIP